MPRTQTAISYALHDVAALVVLGGFMIHVYQSTASEPSTFRSMISGTVIEARAWTNHPGWYREVTGRDPRRAISMRYNTRPNATSPWKPDRK